MVSQGFHGIFNALQRESMDKRTPQEDDRAERAGGATGEKPTTGQVAVDIYEQDNYYIIRAPIAGVRLSDLDIEIADNTVTIRGNRVQGDEVADDQYYVRECFFGPFSRTVTLPCQVDPKKVRATFNKECVLKILVPKEEKVKIVRISES